MGVLQMLAASLAVSLVVLLATLDMRAEAVTLTVSSTGGNASSPFLYGIMFEVSTKLLIKGGESTPW